MQPTDCEAIADLGDGYIEWEGWFEISLGGPLHVHLRCLWVECDGQRISSYIDPETGNEYDDENDLETLSALRRWNDAALRVSTQR